MSKSNYPIDTLILCGGLGTRLRSTIGEKQKVLAPIEDKPFLALLIKYLQDQGLNRIILCSGYQSSDLEEFVSQSDFSAELIVSKEIEPLGTGGAVKLASTLIKSDPFFVINGDSFCQLDYKDFLDFHFKMKANVSMVLTEVDCASDYGSVQVNNQNHIVQYQEKEEAGKQFINAGIYCIQNQILSMMPAKDKFSLETELFEHLIGNEFYGFKTQGDFIDIGTPQRYKDAQKIIKKIS